MINLAYIDSVKIHDTTSGLATRPFALFRAEGLLGSATPREDRPQQSRRHGLYELTTYYDGRAISLSGRCYETSLAALWSSIDLLKTHFSLNGLEHTLKWQRMGESGLLTAVVTPNGQLEVEAPTGRVSPICNWHVDLIASDPRMYGATENSFTFASTGTVTNDGNFSSAPVITFNNPGVNPGLRNNELAAENEIKFLYGGGGTALVVDVRTREVFLDGVSRPDLIDPLNNDFWSLVSGSNSLTKTGGAASITIEWFDAYS